MCFALINVFVTESIFYFCISEFCFQHCGIPPLGRTITLYMKKVKLFIQTRRTYLIAYCIFSEG